MNYIVYKTTNLKNSKIYIGVHYTNPDINDGYIGCGISKKDLKKGKCKGFPAAVHKYGYNNFKRETLFIYPDTEQGRIDAYKKEAELVNEEFLKREDVYNLILGGLDATYDHFKQVAQYTIEGKFIQKWDSVKSAKEATGAYISGCLNGTYKYSAGFQWREYVGEESEKDIDPIETKEKTVYQFDLQGNLIKTWKSTSEASKQFNNPSAASTAIRNVCHKITRQAYGYYWSFKCKFEFEAWTGKPVAKYNDAGEFLESFSSLKEAAESVGLKGSASIISAIKGTQKRAKGFRWRYFYGNTDNIKPL